MIRENVFKRSSVQEAIHRGETEKAVRIFLNTVMSKEGFFYQLPSQARGIIMDNVKSLDVEYCFCHATLYMQDAQS